MMDNNIFTITGIWLMTAVCLTCLYLVVSAIHDVYFHPLARFPGPRHWIISRVPFASSLINGSYQHSIKHFHERYGSIVRIGRNDLSFTSGEAWNDVLSQAAGFEKDPRWTTAAKGVKRSLLSAPRSEHDRYRQLLSPAFSPKTLKSQEHMIQGFISLFLDKLAEDARQSSKVNLKSWFEWLGFDTNSVLSFGESFHALERPENRPFIVGIVKKIQAVMYIIASAYVPRLRIPILSCVPKAMWKAHVQHRAYVKEKLLKRLQRSDDPQKPDFIACFSRNGKDGDFLTEEELVSNMEIVLIAGSETVATTLLAAVHELLQKRNKYALLKLQHEIRSTFGAEAEITAESTSKLPYLNAVIEETLRRCAPAPYFAAHIVPPTGATICGHYIPGATSVCVSQIPTFHSPLNFSSPTIFCPERFLPSAPPSEIAHLLSGAYSNPNLTPTSAEKDMNRHMQGEGKLVHNPKALQPFSYGPRNCIGRGLAYLQLRLVLARLLWRFELELAEGEEEWDWLDQRVFLLWEKRDLWAALKEREVGN